MYTKRLSGKTCLNVCGIRRLGTRSKNLDRAKSKGRDDERAGEL